MSFQQLASYACHPDQSRGRLVDEPPSATRTPFQRDRDRIIHAGAFRKLQYKTQVFVYHEGDYYRTRLTHSLEVAQIARSIARALGLSEDLAEAVALAHDLGHTPFGHAGEDALRAAMEPFGGFDHNEQTFRVVTLVEERYPAFNGLNLTWETLEGIAKHNGPVAPPLPYALAEANRAWDLDLATHASAEAQVAAIADDIAYNHHDLHDGLRAGLFTEDDLTDLPLVGPALAEVDQLHPGLEVMRRRHEALRRVFGTMVEDVIATARQRLAEIENPSVDAVRNLGAPVVGFSEVTRRDVARIKSFLFKRMYRAPSVMVERERVTRILEGLFPCFMSDIAALPEEWRKEAAQAEDETTRARVVLDYVAGMTDRFALLEYQRLIGGGSG